jgi:hypothetical protein
MRHGHVTSSLSSTSLSSIACVLDAQEPSLVRLNVYTHVCMCIYTHAHYVWMHRSRAWYVWMCVHVVYVCHKHTRTQKKPYIHEHHTYIQNEKICCSSCVEALNVCVRICVCVCVCLCVVSSNLYE